ncbi:glycosyltransferase family 39 protein [Robiginitalea sp. M366]|uniref:ArnT family glycosyltransferase n=1 Tax=Robiginitalea aestuariiviva TaxID=3036903 RepID=UPI00240CF85D|nr:glycosyltransferase family 39 protein [Robiginitalea aestuariiviva]MDG1571763.1 glycosyltransferase family 39 protein [Robiginitalea aestuariiviva]
MRPHLPRVLLWGLVGLLGLNLLQASLTELLYDEAYYWYYAQQPAWGYFDHPPMVAWMIWAGSQLFSGELGVRLLSTFMGIGTLCLLWSLIDAPGKHKRAGALLLWFLSIVLLQAYGFLALPDTPLLFFTALFLWVYRKFLQDPGPLQALFLGLAMAGLMYSKYHAALVILFTLASNPGLLRNRWAWMALAVSLTAYAPHLGWLYQQDFVTVRYHLFERPNQPYNFAKFTAGYFLNLIALFGLTFPWVYAALYRHRGTDRFQKALQYMAWGILIFFFVSSFQRRIQTQWLIACCIPLALIVGQQLAKQPAWGKWFLRAAIANLVILFWLRLGLAYEPLFPVHFEAHGNRAWVERLLKTADGAEVVFENSYRQASMYSFYSGRPSFSMNNDHYRKNQYSIDDSEAYMQGRRVFYAPVVPREGPYWYLDDRGQRKYGTFMDPFQSLRKLEAWVDQGDPLTLSGTHDFRVRNPYAAAVAADSLQYGLALLDPYKRIIRSIPVQPIEWEEGRLIQPSDTLQFQFEMPKGVTDQAAYLRAVVRLPGLHWGLNGMPQKLEP